MQKSSDGGDPLVDIEVILHILEELPVTLAVLTRFRARGETIVESDVVLSVEFDETLSPIERTRTHLAVIDRVSAALHTDDVDVVPLSRAAPDLVRKISEDGTVTVESRISLDAYLERSAPTGTHEEWLDELDPLLTDLERVV